jgi:hypothetical protein
LREKFCARKSKKLTGGKSHGQQEKAIDLTTTSIAGKENGNKTGNRNPNTAAGDHEKACKNKE